MAPGMQTNSSIPYENHTHALTHTRTRTLLTINLPPTNEELWKHSKPIIAWQGKGLEGEGFGFVWFVCACVCTCTHLHMRDTVKTEATEEHEQVSFWGFHIDSHLRK